MIRLFTVLFCALPCLAGIVAQAEELDMLEEILERNLSVHFTYTAVFDTHPPGAGDNTGNIFNFVPHGQLAIRHSAIGIRIGHPESEIDEPGPPAASLSMRILTGGLVAEAERGEAHHIIAKVMDRNYIEPALRKVFRRKLGHALVNTLDKTVVDRISDRLASEILSRVPVTASLRQFMVEIGRVLEPGRSVRFHAGILQPATGPPRDATGRTRLDMLTVSGSELQHRMSYPARTLAAEISYRILLSGERSLRISGGIHQAQDPDATLGQTFRNAVFDEKSTELSPDKVDSPYLQVVIRSSEMEAYVSVADSEGLSLAAGFHYRLTEQTEIALHGAYHDPDPDYLTRLEEFAETTHKKGLSVTLLHDLNDSFTGYAMVETAEGAVGRRKGFRSETLEAGLVYKITKSARLAVAAYGRERDDDTDTGIKISFGAGF